jgi:hypothetical protein
MKAVINTTQHHDDSLRPPSFRGRSGPSRGPSTTHLTCPWKRRKAKRERRWRVGFERFFTRAAPSQVTDASISLHENVCPLSERFRRE